MTAYKALHQVRNLLDQAIDIMHETGDIDSVELDEVASRLRSLSEYITLSDELRRDL